MEGFTPAEIKELKGALADVKKGLEQSLEAKFDERLKPMEEDAKKNQQALDHLLVQMKEVGQGTIITGKKTFGEALLAGLEEKRSELEYMEKSKDKDAKVRIDLKQVGDMGTGTNLTGNSQATYNNRQGIVPNQKINARDLVPTVISETGTFVTYRETGSEGGIGLQTEGSEKSQIDYDLTEIKTVNGYIAGFARFTKQMMRNLPWLQSTLPRMLMRDFYKKENSHFWDIVATGATGFSTTVETEDNKQIIDILMGRADRDFNNSFILCKNALVGRLLKLLYDTGNYLGAGSVVGTPGGIVTISNTPIIGVSWAKSADKIMVIDNDFIERVQTEALAVEFSYEDYKNFTENKVTARVECFENFNMLRTDAHSYTDLGNSSES